MKKLLLKAQYKLNRKKVIDQLLHRLSNPQVSKMRDFEATVLKQARQSNFKFKDFEIAEYCWGHGPRKALLIHGWEGHAGNFAALIPILVDSGFTVTAFDAPAHGQSSKGTTTLFDYANVVSHYLKNDFYELFVSHSFGSVPLTFALDRADAYPLNKLMLITSPDRFDDRVKQITDMIGLPKEAAEHVMDVFDERFGVDCHTLSVSNFCAKLQPIKAMILHGEEDKVLPPSWSAAVAQQLKNCERIDLKDAGHYRILWDQRTQNHLHRLIENEASN